MAKTQLELFLRLLKHVLNGSLAHDLDDASFLVVAVDNRHARLDKGAEALAYALGVIVGPPAGLAALNEPPLELVLGAVVEEDEAGGADGLLKHVCLVHLAGEAVDKKLSLDACDVVAVVVGGAGGVELQGLAHGLLDQLHGHLHGHDGAVADAGLDEVAEFGAVAILLGAEKVPRRQVGEAVLGHELGRLGAFAGSGTAQHEYDGHVCRGEGWRGCHLGRGGLFGRRGWRERSHGEVWGRVGRVIAHGFLRGVYFFFFVFFFFPEKVSTLSRYTV